MSTNRIKVKPPEQDSDDLTITVPIPRSALTVVTPPPELVSQKNVEQVLGVPRRAYLDALPLFRAGGGMVTSLGKLRLVDRVAFVAWLRSRGTMTTAAAPANEVARPAGADDVLRDLGFARAGGRR